MKPYEVIRSLREERNWSQKDMAEKLEMSVNGYAKIERGETGISVVRLEQIAKVLDVDIHELLPLDDNRVCQVVLGDNNHGNNLYNAEQELLIEIEKLKTALTHKEELLAQQARELATLQSFIELLKQSQ
ncbi:helix-turn-helix domain-containing protein [Neisseria dumasiana]|uniref:helix-turn-helix domain-containing protein n=1 Tax=Neisseria dumasiana TaxID=1931275 RepID=UPI000A18D9EA|nr:helix-turn-helix transcriptional regulator [Neisseria dumasiana]OSI14638.1 hypothetical protein BV914_09665 [Neisseria dumasiana]